MADRSVCPGWWDAARRLKMLLTGAIIDAREALRIGLVDEVVPAAELMIASGGIGWRNCRRRRRWRLRKPCGVVDEGLDLPLDLALLREADRFGYLCDTADKAEGTRAFLEKRHPVWKGE